MIEIPVYVFTGFLDSGKTKFIQETLEDERFNAGERTLVLLFEDHAEIVDYKTDHTGLDEASVREKHSAQVALYRKAAQLAGLKVQKSLVYLFYTGNSVEIEV